jgi:hypothetical protein
MNMNSLVNRLENERNMLDHRQAVDRFMQETEYLREKPARRGFSGSQASWKAAIASLGVIGMIAITLLGLLH